jgi:hypothetical protein
MQHPNYLTLANKFRAYLNCVASGNEQWMDMHELEIERIMTDAPSGSGVDCGTKFSLELSDRNKLVLTFSFHHMNENGFYDGWTDHRCIIKPDFGGFRMKITGRDKNSVKDYLYDLFSHWLNETTKA